MSRLPKKFPQEFRSLGLKAIEEGWEISHSGGNHLKWTPPTGPPVFTAATPRRNGHFYMNARQKLIRAGLGVRAALPGLDV